MSKHAEIHDTFECDRCGKLVLRPRLIEIDVCDACRRELDDWPNLKEGER